VEYFLAFWQRPPFAGGALTNCDPSGPFAWRRSTDLSEQLVLADSFVKWKKFFLFRPSNGISRFVCAARATQLNFTFMPRCVVELSGHIIDSLLLAKILDLILGLGAEFKVLDMHIGQRRSDRSHARIQIDASTPELLERVVAKVKEHGALPAAAADSLAAQQSRGR
jgi:hypothetical protein